MKNNIYNLVKIILLIFIFSILVIINHNIRHFGRAILKQSNQLEQEKSPQKATITKNSGIYIGDLPPCLTVTAFIDYECVYCRRFMVEVFPLIRSNYINTGKVSFEFRNLPLPMHENAFLTAQTALCANNQNKYMEFSKEVFEVKDALNTSMLKALMNKIGVSNAAYLKCIKDTTIKNKINFDIDECKKNAISGTPTFVINGNVFVGLIPYPDFKTIIDKELAKNPSQNTCH